METEGKNGNLQALNVESDPVKVVQSHEDGGVTSAHTVGHDSWQQVGLLLVTSFNCGYILSFSNLMLVPLGWIWGIICLFVVGLFSIYSSWLLAGFHFIDGQRFIRYRDVMGFLFGREMFYATWIFQFLILLLGNMGFILLGGRALKEIHSEFSDTPLRLQYFIVVTGAAYFIFASVVPTMSAMRRWLGISTVLTFTYITILLVVLVKDGKSNKSRDYEISGSKVNKVFNAFGAIAAIIVCNNSGILPEIQSTVRRPAVTNMRKALYSQFTVGLVVYYGVSLVGYWAYGSTVSVYLPEELSGPRWVKVLINLVAFVQSIISQHMFVAPVHEALDTKYLNLKESMHSRKNIKRLLYLRALVFSGNTLVAAAFPFMGDFVNLLGSFSLVPLTFVFPSMIFLKVKGKTARTEKKVWHWTMIIVFSIIAVATTIAALRSIIHNIRTYNFFADE